MRLSCYFMPWQVIVSRRGVDAGDVEVYRKSGTRETVLMAGTVQRPGVST